jgi:hypothetical protein
MPAIEKRLTALEQAYEKEQPQSTIILYDARIGCDLVGRLNLPPYVILLPYNGREELDKYAVLATVQPGLIAQLLP